MSLAIFFLQIQTQGLIKVGLKVIFMINSAGFRVQHALANYNFPKRKGSGLHGEVLKENYSLLRSWHICISLVLLNVSCEWVLGQNFYPIREPVSGYR